MNGHAIMCTRTNRRRKITSDFCDYLRGVGIEPHFVVGAKSIFSGYAEGVTAASPKPSDIVILCHDDINVLSSYQVFLDAMSECSKPAVGFVGVLGSRSLPPNAFWADNSADRGGMTFLGPSHRECSIVGFGPCGKALVLDGVFLAAQWKKLKKIGLSCPSYLDDGWHMYDMHYTYRAHQLGYKNLIFPLYVLHDRVESEENAKSVDTYHKARADFAAYHQIPPEGLRLVE